MNLNKIINFKKETHIKLVSTNESKDCKFHNLKKKYK